MQPFGQCDAPGWLCIDTLKYGTVSVCNVAYLISSASSRRASQPPGPTAADRGLPSCAGGSTTVAPLLVLPSAQPSQVLVLALSAAQWEAMLRALVPAASPPPPPYPPPPLALLPTPPPSRPATPPTLPVPPYPPGCGAGTLPPSTSGACEPAVLILVSISVSSTDATASPAAVAAAVSSAAPGVLTLSAQAAAAGASSVAASSIVQFTLLLTPTNGSADLSVTDAISLLSSASSAAAGVSPLSISVAVSPPFFPGGRRLSRRLLQPAVSSYAANVSVSLAGATAVQAEAAKAACFSLDTLSAISAASGGSDVSVASSPPHAVSSTVDLVVACAASDAPAALAALGNSTLLASAVASASIPGVVGTSTPAVVAGPGGAREALLSSGGLSATLFALAPASPGLNVAPQPPSSTPQSTPSRGSAGVRSAVAAGSSVGAIFACVVAAAAVVAAKKMWHTRRVHAEGAAPKGSVPPVGALQEADVTPPKLHCRTLACYDDEGEGAAPEHLGSP